MRIPFVSCCSHYWQHSKAKLSTCSLVVFHLPGLNLRNVYRIQGFSEKANYMQYFVQNIQESLSFQSLLRYVVQK